MASITATAATAKASEYALLQAVKQAIIDGQENPDKPCILGAMKYQDHDNVITWDVEFGDSNLVSTHTIMEDNLDPDSIDLESDKPSELKDDILICWLEECTMLRDPEDFNGGWSSRIQLEHRPELEREREEQEERDREWEPEYGFNGEIINY